MPEKFNRLIYKENHARTKEKVRKLGDEKSQHKNKAKALKILKSRLLEVEREKQNQEQSESRKSQIGTGDRSEKIRTYNFPQSRVTDHRIGLALHQPDLVLNGDIEPFIQALRTQDQALKLQGEVG